MVTVKDICAIIFNSKPSDGILACIEANLGKNSIDSIGDVRKIIMMFDKQNHPTPIVIQFCDPDIFFEKINGLNLPVDPDDVSVSLPASKSGIYEPHICNIMRRLITPNSCVLDIGANVGYHTILMSSLVGVGGKVYAFEPNSENCRILLMGAAHNRMENIRLYPVALSDNNGYVHFSTHMGSNGGFISDGKALSQAFGTIVPTIKLDDMNLTGVDFVKIDVEGAEYRALKGAENMLRTFRPAVVCEFSKEMIRRVSDIEPESFLCWMLSMQYKLFLLDKKSSEPISVESVSSLMDGWGHIGRIEDLLFLP